MKVTTFHDIENFKGCYCCKEHTRDFSSKYRKNIRDLYVAVQFFYFRSRGFVPPVVERPDQTP